MDWGNLERFPDGNQEWEIMRRGQVVGTGETEARTLARTWNLTHSELIASPLSKKFLPALCVPELSEFVHGSYCRTYRIAFSAVGVIFGAMALAILIFAENLENFSGFILMMALIGALLIGEYQVVTKRRQFLQERALYINWLLSNRNWSYFILPGVALTMGCIQLAYQNWVGDLDSLVIGYGVYYQAVATGEYWRYVIGPFFHSGFVHWAVNFSILLMALLFVHPLSRNTINGVFAVALLASVVAAQYTDFGGPNDGFLGISGGVLALLAWALGHYLRSPCAYPRRFYFTLVPVSVACILFPLLVNPSSSFVAHITGFILGLFLGFAGVGAKYKARELCPQTQ